MVVNKMHVQQKPKYPKAVFFIISNEFCERFCFYGMRTILSLYLLNMLKYSEDTSTIIYHVFICFTYFFPLLGAIISDSWLGKYRTILYLSIIYAIGQVILSLSAATPIGIPQKEFSILGLLLVAFGTGGIKPCVSSFGGDQFIIPQQERHLVMFFSFFYFAINTGSFISTLLTPLPIFWALYDQQGSQWTFQATRMDGQMGSWVLLPDQLQAVNPFLIIIFIPIFETCIYPVFAKIHFINTPLKKLVVGGFLASVAFVAAGIVELQIEKTIPILPTKGLAQIRIFNTMDCSASITMNINENVKDINIGSLSMVEMLEVETNGPVTIPYTANFTDCYDKGYITLKKIETGDITGEDGNATSWVITPSGLKYKYEDKVEKPEKGKPVIRSLIYLEPGLNNATLKLFRNDELKVLIPVSSVYSESELEKIEDLGEYNIYLDDELLDKNVPFKSGGVYAVVGSHVTHNQPKIVGKTVTVTPPNSMHMAWMLPQYIIITMAEVMFSVTGLEFAFTQAPRSMKSLLAAGWLLSVAVGNLIVVIVKGARPFDRQMYEIFLYAGLMAVVITIFAVMTMFYTYVEIPEEEDTDGAIPLEEKTGNVNSAYKEDEK